MKAINLWTGEKLFARKDYEGLTKWGAEKLGEARRLVARNLREARNNGGGKFAKKYPIEYKKVIDTTLREGRDYVNKQRAALLK